MAMLLGVCNAIVHSRTLANVRNVNCLISCAIVVKKKDLKQKRHTKSIWDRYDYVWEPVNIDKMTIGWVVRSCVIKRGNVR